MHQYSGMAEWWKTDKVGKGSGDSYTRSHRTIQAWACGEQES